MEKITCSIPMVLNQISKVLTNLCGHTVFINYTGEWCLDSNGKFLIVFEEINISSSIISKPFPQYFKDEDGCYKVNRIHLGKTILEDTSKGYFFTDDEIKTVIEGESVWGYEQ